MPDKINIGGIEFNTSSYTPMEPSDKRYPIVKIGWMADIFSVTKKDKNNFETAMHDSLDSFFDDSLYTSSIRDTKTSGLIKPAFTDEINKAHDYFGVLLTHAVEVIFTTNRVISATIQDKIKYHFSMEIKIISANKEIKSGIEKRFEDTYAPILERYAKT